MTRPADEEVEFAMDLTYLVTRTHTLPQAGGLLDQDYYYILLLKAGLRALDKREEQQQKKDKAEADRAKARARG